MKVEELEIIDYGYSGEGVAKKEGKVFFVPKTIIGEKVEASIVKENSKFCFCKFNKLISSSKTRKLAPCRYYQLCGGCNFQHIDYQIELKIKKDLLIKEINKASQIEDIEIISDEENYAYRNKVRFKVKNKRLGFFEEKTNNFIEIEKCLLISREMNDYIEKINDFLASSKNVFDEVIINSISGEIVLDFTTKEGVGLSELKKVFSCKVMINHKGDSVLTEQFGLKYEFVGDTFRQVNDSIADKLYSDVLGAVSGKVVLNAYSGAGVLSGLLAKKAEKVYGIELNKNAHNSAETLKFINGIENLVNICGYAEKEIEKIKEKLDFVIIDPPRAGCDKLLLNSLLKKEVSQIGYISCNPSTLVRDLKILNGKYDIEKVKIFDMFPRTANMETFTILKLKR